MIPYEIESRLPFGEFKGQTLLEAYLQNPVYVEWCKLHFEDFVISEEAAKSIGELIKPDYAALDWKIQKAIRGGVYKARRDPSRQVEPANIPEEDKLSWWEANGVDLDRENFYALTDGQNGDYDDWRNGGGDFDMLRDSLGM